MKLGSRRGPISSRLLGSQSVLLCPAVSCRELPWSLDTEVQTRSKSVRASAQVQRAIPPSAWLCLTRGARSSSCVSLSLSLLFRRFSRHFSAPLAACRPIFKKELREFLAEHQSSGLVRRRSGLL